MALPGTKIANARRMAGMGSRGRVCFGRGEFGTPGESSEEGCLLGAWMWGQETRTGDSHLTIVSA